MPSSVSYALRVWNTQHGSIPIHCTAELLPSRGSSPTRAGWLEFHTYGSSLPWVTALRLNVTGRSNSTTYLPVSAKSCIIGPSGTGMSVVRVTVPVGSTTTCWTWSQAQK